MGFLKRHYEKIILSIVLIGLAAAAGLLTVKVNKVKKELQADFEAGSSGGSSVNYDVAAGLESRLSVISNPPPTQIDGEHRLFNPVLWKETAAGLRFPVREGSEAGVGALTVTGIKPLLFTISFDKPVGNNPERMRYSFKFHQQDAVSKRGRPPRPVGKYAGIDGKLGEWPYGEQTVEMYLKGVEGDPVSPTGFVLGMRDTDGQDMVDTIALAVDAPYEDVRSHLVDLRYDVADTDFKAKREGDEITLEGERYNIVAISETLVVLSAVRNGKRYEIPIDSNTAPVP
jgi:hypothetical protein